jgi:hypothetical protein
VTFLSFEMTTMMCGASAMLLYAVGLIGAQKRNHRYLYAYGVLSIFMMVMSLVFGLVLVGLVMSHRGQIQQQQQQPHSFPQHVAHWPLQKLESSGMIVKTPVKQHGVYVPELENKNAPLQDVQKPRITFKLDENNNAKRHEHKVPVDYADAASSSSDADSATDTDNADCDVQLTPLGYGVIALTGLLSLFLFALKVKS